MIRNLLLFCCLLIAGCRVEKVDQLFNMYDQESSPGAAVMVIKDDKPLFQKAYGLAHIEKKIPVELQTNFRLASVTKQFTAMCIMILAEQGKLSYEQTLTEIFPGFPAYGAAITIRHLLQHTSGLVDYEDLLATGDTSQVLDADVLQMMQARDSTYFLPGTHHRYSNSGYAMLALIVEKRSGKPFAQFLQENIFKPIKMDNTVAFEKGVCTVKHRAFGYAVDDRGCFRFTDQSRTSAVLGDGGIYSSVIDLFKWDQALYTEKLVKLATLEQAFSSDVQTDKENVHYGYGWRIDEYRGHRRMHHTGSTCGFATIIQRYPDDHFTVIILTNRNEPALNELADKLTDLFLKEVL